MYIKFTEQFEKSHLKITICSQFTPDTGLRDIFSMICLNNYIDEKKIIAKLGIYSYFMVFMVRYGLHDIFLFITLF